jgi:pSer/pThr/pTyr-binding forkhead associated (FHA) protein
MNKYVNLDIAQMEGRDFIIGREGHIYIESLTASKRHAEITVTNGRIYLRDLESTNGTFLVKGRRLVPFTEGYVNPLHYVYIGDQRHMVLDLLATALDFAAIDENTTQVNLYEKAANNRG